MDPHTLFYTGPTICYGGNRFGYYVQKIRHQ